jgi:hypothetical protein
MVALCFECAKRCFFTICDRWAFYIDRKTARQRTRSTWRIGNNLSRLSRSTELNLPSRNLIDSKISKSEKSAVIDHIPVGERDRLGGLAPDARTGPVGSTACLKGTSLFWVGSLPFRLRWHSSLGSWDGRCRDDGRKLSFFGALTKTAHPQAVLSPYSSIKIRG